MFHVDWFWLFILGVVVASIVSGIMRNHQREKTIRAAIEKGASLDPATVEALRHRTIDPPGDRRFGLLMGAIMTFFVGVGLCVMGYFINFEDHQVIWPLIGVGGLMWCIAAGLFVGSRFAPPAPSHNP